MAAKKKAARKSSTQKKGYSVRVKGKSAKKATIVSCHASKTLAKKAAERRRKKAQKGTRTSVVKGCGPKKAAARKPAKKASRKRSSKKS